jgi:WD40 repeat protein
VGLDNGSFMIFDWSTNTALFAFPWIPITIFYLYTFPNMKLLPGGLVAASSVTSSFNIWDVTTGQVKFSLPSYFFSIEMLSNSNWISSSWDFYLRIWNSQTGQLIYQVNTGANQLVLKQTADPNLVASGCWDTNIYIWDINTLNRVYTLVGHVSRVSLLEVLPSGLLLSATLDSGNQTLRLWNMTLNSSLSSITNPDAWICRFKVIGSNQLVVAYQANYVRFFNITSDNALIFASQVTTSEVVNGLALTSGGILLLALRWGSLLFMNPNTSTFVQALLPTSSSVGILNLDIMGTIFAV